LRRCAQPRFSIQSASVMAPERAVPSAALSADCDRPGLAPMITSAVSRLGVISTPAVAWWKASNPAGCARRRI